MAHNKPQKERDKLNELLESIPEGSNSKTSCSRGSQLASALKEAFNKTKSNRIDRLSNA
jgi:hypothetical protein